MDNKQENQDIIVLTEAPSTKLVYQQRRLNFYTLTEQEIDNLSEIGGASSVYVGFTTFCLAVLLSFLVSVLTIPFDDPVKLAIFIAVIIVASILTIFFGIMWIRSIKRASRLKRSIKKNSG
jgi:CBS domain containing-hemolysin-like protein